ncbi:MAG: TetR family transcriptional regulator [Gammaproteobacteria bacterium]|jgi:AcrR family transcriptional regulator|nr:TetR family transcriptional regulator [Gammaproteobacteria bacterium]
MARQYDSSRRRKAAEQTRNDILQAALKLHWEGITGFEPLAREAGCSVATLRKHFPSKETLFQHCTRAFAKTLTMPDLTALGEISETAQRVEQSVSELCRMHEAMFGYAWLAAQQSEISPTLQAEMNAYEGLADAIAVIITPSGSTRAPLIRGLLDFLTYRALRLAGQLSPEQASTELLATLHPLTVAGTD